MKRAVALAAIAALALGVFACKKKKPLGPPPPPPRVELLADTVLRADSNDSSASVASLSKGAVLEIVKLGSKWTQVQIPEGAKGYVRRESFARRTLVVGTDNFPYIYNVGDKLRKIPALDVIKVESVARMMPGSPAGGLEGAKQLESGLKAEIVIAVSGAGRQFLYEMVDLKSEQTVANGATRDTIYLRDAVQEVVDAADRSFSLAHAGAVPAASAAASATPVPKPTIPHPNAVLPLTVDTSGAPSHTK